ncbi:hypothetical protein D9M70_540230 [compost metagenome]
MGIERDACRVGNVVASADLPQAGKTGARLQVVDSSLVVELQLILHHRPRADDAHFTADDVDELRQFVEAQLAQNAADDGDPGVILQLARRAPLLIGRRIASKILLQNPITVRPHCAELQATERLPVMTDTAMAIKDAAAVGKLDERNQHQKERAQKDERQ